MFCNKLEDMKVCQGCLCTNRRLAPIDKYYEILKKNLGPDLKQSYRNENRNLLICWECQMVLKKFDDLLLKVKKAQYFFKKRTKINKVLKEDECISLSTLRATTKLDFDYSYMYELDGIKIEKTETVSNKFESDIEIIVECKAEIDKLENYDDTGNALEDGQHSNIENDNFNDWIDTELVNYDNDIASNKNIADDVNRENTTIKEEISGTDKTEDKEFIKVLQNEVNIKRKKSHLKIPEPQRYKTVRISNYNINESRMRFYNRIPITSDEVLSWMNKEKNSKDFSKTKFYCETCVAGFDVEKQLLQHNEEFHSDKMHYECDMCGIKLSTNSEMATHCSEHYTKLKCVLCNYTAYRMSEFDDHIISVHRTVTKCLICKAKFPRMFEYVKHHKYFHKKYICDYCGKKFTKKSFIERHMYSRHSDYKCKICGIQLKTYVNHRAHMRRQHVKNPTEETFCVECNIQFDNIDKYKDHFKAVVRHRPPVKKSFPCPECGKTYNKKITMKYHYNYEHLKKTQFYCTKCDRYFLNGFGLRQHTANIHDKITKPKNKICYLCGRGFNTNRILNNHIRTHTGERPFLCTQCPAAFGQKTALVAHTRAIHKEGRRN
ncbi:myoneurin-like [Achroia grisella]|uniref:myoneurin-like n=1 Tax=Achroia grisella TaxID=688607 RepID=UPI0027D2A45F|nr:myoneurin-like [Achroia grisella]